MERSAIKRTKDPETKEKQEKRRGKGNRKKRWQTERGSNPAATKQTEGTLSQSGKKGGKKENWEK